MTTATPKRRPFVRAGWRVLLVLVAFGLAITAFLAGAWTSERPSLADADVLTKLYSAIGLFVFGGIDLGAPAGGPGWARAMLWVAYFLCPLITAAALIEGVMALLRPVPWRLNRHLVLSGPGEIAMLWLRTLRKELPRRQVVAVVPDDDAPDAEQIRHMHCHLLAGDITSDAVLTRLDIHRARGVLLLSDDDLANLDAAWRIAETRPHCPVVAHVGDLALRRDLKNAVLPGAMRVFNAFELAAEHVVNQHMFAKLAADETVDVIVIAGFGRFGQALLDALHRLRPGAFHHVVIVDAHASRKLHGFREQIPLADYRIETANCDIGDPKAWQQLEEHLCKEGARPVIVLTTGDTRLNLHVAMVHARHYDSARTLVRVQGHSGFAQQLAATNHFDLVDPSVHIAESLTVHAAFGMQTTEAVRASQGS